MHYFIFKGHDDMMRELCYVKGHFQALLAYTT